MEERERQFLKAVGKRIRELRKAQGMSQENLAFVAGLEQYHISKIENATNSPSITTLAAIAWALGTSVSKMTDVEAGLPPKEQSKV